MQNRDTAILARTKTLLQQGWCKNALAKDKDGHFVMPEADTATEWCLIGGIVRAAHDLGFDNHKGAFASISALIPNGWISEYNNSHSKTEVLSLLDEAIEGSTNSVVMS